MNRPDRDALVRGIGELLLRDIATAGHDLDGYALIADYSDGARRLSGFGYREGQSPVAATPKDHRCRRNPQELMRLIRTR